MNTPEVKSNSKRSSQIPSLSKIPSLSQIPKGSYSPKKLQIQTAYFGVGWLNPLTQHMLKCSNGDDIIMGVGGQFLVGWEGWVWYVRPYTPPLARV